MSEEKTVYDVNEARKALALDNQQRVERCAQRIRQVTEEEGCQLVARLGITADGRVVAEVQIIALEN